MIGAIWAQSADGYIGKNGGIPWDSPEDLKHFSKITRGSTVVMGRNTWASTPPLTGRQEIVLSSRVDASTYFPEVTFVKSIDAALAAAIHEDVWFIGGASVIESAYALVNKIWVTFIDFQVGEGARAPYVPFMSDFRMRKTTVIPEGTIAEFDRVTPTIRLGIKRLVISYDEIPEHKPTDPGSPS